MNTYYASLVIATTMLCATQATANPFEKLTPYITKQAEQWVTKTASTLNDDLQSTYLNLFAYNSPESIELFIKCAKHIESNPEMLESYEDLGESIMNIIKKYVEPIQKKIAAKEGLTKEEEQTVFEKLQIKIQELIAYINAIYYEKLYNHIAQNNTKALTYEFDNNGMIPQEKRTKALPKSL